MRIAASAHPAREASHAKEPPLCHSSSHAAGVRVKPPPLRAAAHGPRHCMRPGHYDGGARAPHAPTTVHGHSFGHKAWASWRVAHTQCHSLRCFACHGGTSAAAGAPLATSHRTGTISHHLHTPWRRVRSLHAERKPGPCSRPTLLNPAGNGRGAQSYLHVRSLNRILFEAHEVSAGDRVVLPNSDARAVHIRQVLLQQGGAEPTERFKVCTCESHPPLSAFLCSGVRWPRRQRQTPS
jgi:hypothetical protein